MCVFGLIMIYPLLWLFTASFKTNEEIFGSLSLLPSHFNWDGYINGWKGSGQYSFGLYFLNTFKLVIPTVFFTVVSSTIVAYGFARFTFPFKNVLFSLMISTLMLPNAVVIIPKYIMFKNFDWLNSYLPFIIPAALATHAFFIFMLVQFFRGLPRELDESAKMDGCNSFMILVRILLPLSKPALISAGIFQFIWTWNDFFNSLIYITSVKKFTVALGLRMALDNSTSVAWNQVLAMSVIAIIPCILVFFFCQKYFVEGIATTGIKG
ncbi:carbohydrate ABC transporter permease [Paenibacillus sp. N5-1-1-5]|uniref:Carbohydrate ABC transporter permease n=2 Tax=Paenibacillus radicis (ex Xue et al. 2023) TaxID=2972489 RepID=A0ABT1YPF9_9BACL|nr:carbohydrate ABC transporter permease [Paenibacillus radicis (ex Xue et al. 2023)]